MSPPLFILIRLLFVAHPGHRALRFLGQIWQIFDPESGFPEDVAARNHVPRELTKYFEVCVMSW